MTDQPSPALPRSLQWALRYLPDYFTAAPGDFHAEMLATLEDLRRRLVARVAPRGHAKSTCASLAYPLWCICTRRRRNIVIITHEASLATQFVTDIRRELETNELIRETYGDLCTAATTDTDDDAADAAAEIPSTAAEAGKRAAPRTRARTRRPWSAGKFTTSTGITVQAKGTGASFRGTRIGPHRPDLVICDDIEHDEHVASPDGRQKLERWLRRVVLPALAPDGQLLVLGSILHHDSLLANLRDPQRFPHWDYRVYRALEAEQQPDGTFRRIALWPARWPVELLDQERERIGTLAFEGEYQASPKDDALRVFRPEWLQRYDESELVEQRLITLMAVDPATGTQHGDFFAIWIGSVDTSTGTIYTRRLVLERIGIVDQVKRVLTLFEQWRPVKVGIETTAYQVALKQSLEEEGRRRGVYLPVVGLRQTAGKLARIEGCAPLFENGTFRLPAVLSPDVEEQFLHFPKAGHDDAPDVCAMGIELAREVRSAGRIEGLVLRRNPYARRGGW